MILPILQYGHPTLRKKCLPVKEITEDTRKFVADMIETMDAPGNGIGLAAIQVGVLLQIIVVRFEIVGPDGQYTFGPPEVYINPVLSQPSQETDIMTEGCLSLPGIRADVERPLSIHVDALDIHGKPISQTLKGFSAREIMHENDHLRGTLFVDRAIPEQKKELEPLLRALKKKTQEQMAAEK